MAQYLLDTDICVELFRHNSMVIDKIEAVGKENCFSVGEFDLLIGSCAVYYGLTMVTSNLRHFSHIPVIVLEDWAGKSKYVL